ncbi:hypothetical protein CEXT_397051 [Caerostris extrusa]|uniref:Uncharacterized protein n=1 Tax=Caerostris extrusa TaxID=172846 RepID=A0AAV4WCV8_CAEEX|nr:hypothetical protein CEXT_397051 [Caerostris extrusa]
MRYGHELTVLHRLCGTTKLVDDGHKKLTCGICPLRQDPHERLQDHDRCQPNHHHLILPVIVAGSPDHHLLLLSRRDANEPEQRRRFPTLFTRRLQGYR